MRKGIPIGNLTSQIFANIYLNELDRFIVHTIKPQAYLRYGDDFIIVKESEKAVEECKDKIQLFLKERLDLLINPKNSIVIKAKQGIHFLGVHIFPKGRRLNKRNLSKIESGLNLKNASSYRGLLEKHGKSKQLKQFNWNLLQKMEDEIQK